jgi:[acyl-carrier-protein] S-malonyltransferase
LSKIAFIFPGQASQYPGMGKELHDEFPIARQAFEEADQALGFSLSQLCFNGPEEELKQTENTQPAILTVSVAAFRVVSSKGFRADYVAGHSLGEYSALVAAGSLNFQDAVRSVRNRGKYMQEAVSSGKGAMAAILGMDQQRVEALCQEASAGEVLSVANLNSQEQVVIAGTASAVARATELAPSRGAKRAILLPVSAPFHCPMMQSAKERLQRDLSAVSLAPGQIPLVSNVDASEISEVDQIRDSLVRQVCSPVRWMESVQYLIHHGVKLFVELGPGRVLSGLVRQIERSAKTANVENVKSLKEALGLMMGSSTAYVSKG